VILRQALDEGTWIASMHELPFLLDNVPIMRLAVVFRFDVH
jgi:hypothetical protein